MMRARKAPRVAAATIRRMPRTNEEFSAQLLADEFGRRQYLRQQFNPMPAPDPKSTPPHHSTREMERRRRQATKGKS